MRFSVILVSFFLLVTVIVTLFKFSRLIGFSEEKVLSEFCGIVHKSGESARARLSHVFIYPYYIEVRALSYDELIKVGVMRRFNVGDEVVIGIVDGKPNAYYKFLRPRPKSKGVKNKDTQ